MKGGLGARRDRLTLRPRTSLVRFVTTSSARPNGCPAAGLRRIRHLDSKNARHHDARMRTTVTLDPDVAASLRELAHQRQLSFKAALNTVLREGLAAPAAGARRRRKFVVEPHDGEFRPGLDLGKLNQLADQLDTEAFLEKARGDR